MHRGHVCSLLYAPFCIRIDIRQEAHGSLLSGHSAIDRNIDRIKTLGWWPSLKTDVTWHIRRCSGCQKSRPSDTQPAPLVPNVQMHAALFGPLKSNNGNPHVLCITDAFTRISVVVPTPDKEATTVATSILHHLIYQFLAPEKIHTDGDKEFINRLSDELWATWGNKHTKTMPAHPQCNAHVDNFNRRIKEYLSLFLRSNTIG